MDAIEKLQKQVQELTEKNELLNKQVKDQNRHITTLEAEKKKPSPEKSSDPVTAFVQRSMRKEAKDLAYARAEALMGKERFDAIKKDVDAFLDKHMTIENTSDVYVQDAINLIFGRAQMDPSHSIHTVKAAPPSGTTDPNPGVNPAPKGPDSPKITAQQAQALGQTPPPIKPDESPPAGTGAPSTEKPPIKTTRDAMESFRQNMHKRMYGG